MHHTGITLFIVLCVAAGLWREEMWRTTLKRKRRRRRRRKKGLCLSHKRSTLLSWRSSTATSVDLEKETLTHCNLFVNFVFCYRDVFFRCSGGREVCFRAPWEDYRLICGRGYFGGPLIWALITFFWQSNIFLAPSGFSLVTFDYHSASIWKNLCKDEWELIVDCHTHPSNQRTVWRLIGKINELINTILINRNCS